MIKKAKFVFANPKKQKAVSLQLRTGGPVTSTTTVKGESGYSGYSGFSSYSGYSGRSGYSGISGYSGVSGMSGYSGRSGYSGSAVTNILPTITVSEDYAVQNDDFAIFCDGTSTLNIDLPTAVGIDGMIFIVKNISNSNVIVNPTGAEQIDDQNTYTLVAKDDSITIISDGMDWRIISLVS